MATRGLSAKQAAKEGMREVASAVVAISIVLGTLVGAAAGYFGGWIDGALMRFTDMVLAFPRLVLLIMIVASLNLTAIWLRARLRQGAVVLKLGAVKLRPLAAETEAAEVRV